MKPLKKNISITIDEDILEEIKLLADDAFRSLSQYINIVLAEHIKQKKSGENDPTQLS